MDDIDSFTDVLQCPARHSDRSMWDNFTSLWLCRDNITSELHVRDVIDYLRQDDVINLDEQELILHQSTNIRRSKQLLDIVFHKDIHVCGAFLKTLKLIYPHLYQMVSEKRVATCDRAQFVAYLASDVTVPEPLEESGEDCVDGFVVPASTAADILVKLRQELRDYYTHLLTWLRPVPWNNAVMLKMDDIYSNVLILDITKGPRLSDVEAKDLEESNLGCLIDELCISHPRRILVEGEPGIGKSTLVRKMTLEWAQETQKSWASKFDQVLMFQPNSLKESVAESILSSLLPKDVLNLPVNQLELKLLDSEIQERTLLIVDGYDEFQEKTLLHNIWNGDIMRRCTMVITSRPGYSADLMPSMERRWFVHGFSKESCLSYTKNYSSEVGCSETIFAKIHDDGFVLSDLRTNPMYLSLICLLVEDKEGHIPESRTGLISEVVSLAVNRTASKLNKHKSDINQLVEYMCQKAYHSLLLGNISALSHTDAEILLQMGFVVQQQSKSKLNPKVQLQFIHKIFQEYFAAQYLSSLPKAELHEKVKTLREQEQRNILVFLAGILVLEKSSELISFYKDLIILHEMNHEDVTIHRDQNNHKAYHLGLECLAESGSFPGSEAVICDIIPDMFRYLSATCSHCLRGFLAGVNYLDLNKDLLLDMRDRNFEKFFNVAFTKELKLTHGVSSVAFKEIVFTENIMSNLVACIKLFPNLKHLYLYSSTVHSSSIDSIEQNNFERELMVACQSMESNLRSIFFQGNSVRHLLNTDFLERCLMSTLNGILCLWSAHMQTVILTELTLDKDTTKLLSQCLKSKGHHICTVILDNILFIGPGLDLICEGLKNCKNLKHIEFSNCKERNSNDDTSSNKLPDSFYTILNNNAMTRFVLQNQELQGRKVAQLLESSLDTLEYLDLSSVSWDSGKCIQQLAFSVRSVTSLILQGLPPELTYLLPSVIREAKSLHLLNLSRNDFSDISLFGNICDSLVDLKKLQNLSLEGCSLIDSHLDCLRNIFEKLSLRYLSLQGNNLMATEDAGIQLCEMLKSHTSLESLTLPMSKYCIETKEHLFHAVYSLPKLTTLHVSTKPCSLVFREIQQCQGAWTESTKKQLPAWVTDVHFWMLREKAFLKAPTRRRPTHGYWRYLCLGPSK